LSVTAGQELPDVRIAPPGPRSRDLAARLAAVESPAFDARRAAREQSSGTEQAPIVYAEGRGANVVDVDGNRYVDLVAGFGALILGHRPEGVARAIAGSTLPTAGTPGYMAPEQSDPQEGKMDARTDVFALGRILQDLMPPAPPRPLAAIARRAAAPDPPDRFPNVQQLAGDVNRFLDGLPVTAYRETVVERCLRFWRRNQVLLLLLSAYLAVKLLLFFFAPALK